MSGEQEIEITSKRTVGAALGIGILLLPFVFAWFTLRKGYSRLARIVSLVWMAAFLLINILSDHPRQVKSPPKDTPTSESEKPSEKPQATPVKQNIQVIKVTAEKLLELNNNQMAAENKFADKKIIIYGWFHGLQKGYNGSYQLSIGWNLNTSLGDVAANLAEQFSGNVESASNNDLIAVECYEYKPSPVRAVFNDCRHMAIIKKSGNGAEAFYQNMVLDGI